MGVVAQRLIADLEHLRQSSGGGEGAQRVAWTPLWMETRRRFQQAAIDLGLEHHLDAAGNSWSTLHGQADRAVILGSHLDSVPNGGWLDGCLGVLAGLEVMRSLVEQYGRRPPVTLRLVDWADEEGARFGRSLFGSSAFAGTSTIAADRARLDRDGVRLDDALRTCGIEIDRIGEAAAEQAHAAAYLELHIEQGPVLEAAGLPLGVVLGTKGVERHALIFRGQEAHSGSTPMAVRRDALAAAARLALEIRPIAMRHKDAVATMGSLKTYPGIVTAVVGRCEATLDMRDLDAVVLAQMLNHAQQASQRFAAQEGCTVEWQKIWSIEPVPFDADLIGLAEQAVLEVAGESLRLPSGPLHDAAEVSRAGIPTVMLFVQSLKGLSHNREEDTLVEHLEMAVEAFARLTHKTIAMVAASA